jgi:SlyX protein
MTDEITTPEETWERRLTELETRQAFQDQTIEELHEVIYLQQGQLDDLARELTRLKGRLAEILPEGQSTGGLGG